MNVTPHNSDSNTTIFLLGAVFNILAFTEWSSFLDYGLKAIIGGIVWLVFKLISEYLSHKLFNKKDNGNDSKYDDQGK